MIAATSLLVNNVATASSEPRLAPRTAAQLLVALEQARPAGFSGTVVETAKLGLPSLTAIGGGAPDASLSIPNLVTGAHTLRIWYAGPERQRLALLGQLSESDVVHNGTDLWTYTSTTRQVTHQILPRDEATKISPHPLGNLTPQQAAEDALKAIDPSTSVTVDRTARVAGRAAYQLVLTPRDDRSLIGTVRLAIDADTSVPLRVQVFAHGASSPAIQIGFTDISFSVPDDSVFRFVPPAGSTVVKGNPLTQTLGSGPLHAMAGSPDAPREVAPGSTPDSVRATKVLGSGWTAVLEINPALKTDQGAAPGPLPPGLLEKIATPVEGGHLITSALLSIFVADDGHIFVGPVSATAIQQVAATGHGL
jgi:outer membrane lipoprotein-sorting protein